MAKASFDLRHLYLKYRRAIFRVAVIDGKGDQSMGTGFHVGEGLIVTAAHVAREKLQSIKRDSDGATVAVSGIVFPDDERIDLAILKTDLLKLPSDGSSKRVERIPLGQYLDAWLGDDFILSKVLVMGYPRIPFAQQFFLVSAEAEVNAIVKKFGEEHLNFILSSTARGGFSGGPVISAAGFVIAIITESLTVASET